MRLANTKLAKQLSSFALIGNDLQFCARAFRHASSLPVRISEEALKEKASAEERRDQIWQFEPFLRAGATVASFEGEERTDNETIKAALFEAAVVTYGRCFNTGLRTRLQSKIFTDVLFPRRSTHELLIAIRNKHVAHSELREEHSTVGVDLVEDPAYGKRPNMVMGIVSGRRYYPSDDRLKAFEEHCNAIVMHYLRPKLSDMARALREQLLQMPPEQFQNRSRSDSATFREQMTSSTPCYGMRLSSTLCLKELADGNDEKSSQLGDHSVRRCRRARPRRCSSCARGHRSRGVSVRPNRGRCRLGQRDH